MRGSSVSTPKTKKGYPITQSVAAELFLLLLIPLLIAAVHVYRLGVAAISGYEANQLKTMMARSAETGTELIHMEDNKIAEEGRYLDLAEAMEKVDAIDFISIANREDGGDGWIKTTVDLEQANLQFWYVVVRGDGRALLVDNTAGTSRELTEEENLFEKCSEAIVDTKAVQWEDDGAYYCLFLHQLDGPLTFDGSPLLYNVADANIGMLVQGDLSFVEDSVRDRVFVYVLILYGLLLVIVTVMCVSVHRSLRVLRNMSGIMQRYRLKQDPLMDELKEQLSIVRSRAEDNELKDLTESFYIMAVNLIDYQDTVDSIMNRYEPFVPEALLRLLHKADPLSVRPGDMAELTGDILQVCFEQCETTDHKLLSEEACKIIKEKGGIVLYIAQSELHAIFPMSEDNADGISKARNAAEEASELIYDLDKDNANAETISIRIRHGVFCLQVIGSEKRMAIRLAEKGSRNA